MTGITYKDLKDSSFMFMNKQIIYMQRPLMFNSWTLKLPHSGSPV